MSNDAPKMKKYIVEAPEPGPGEKLSSGGIRKNGKMVVTVYCIIKIYKVAKQKRTMLHVHFGQSCIVAS